MYRNWRNEAKKRTCSHRSFKGRRSIHRFNWKKSGRGAYLSLDKETVMTAKKKNVLANHLQVSIDLSIYDELLQLIEKENLFS